MNLKNECLKNTKNSKIKVEEKRKKYILNNPLNKLVHRYKIDHCCEFDGKICDYLLLCCSEKIAFFIELKGCDLEKGIIQLDNTYEKVKGEIKSFKINARAVISRAPTPDMKSLTKIRFNKKIEGLGGSFVLRENYIDCDTV